MLWLMAPKKIDTSGIPTQDGYPSISPEPNHSEPKPISPVPSILAVPSALWGTMGRTIIELPRRKIVPDFGPVIADQGSGQCSRSKASDNCRRVYPSLK